MCDSESWVTAITVKTVMHTQEFKVGRLPREKTVIHMQYSHSLKCMWLYQLMHDVIRIYCMSHLMLLFALCNDS
jgi:hypothetical protein